VTDLTFAQAARRNYTVPIVAALVVLGIAGGVLYRHMVKQIVIGTVTHTAVYPVHVKPRNQPQTGSFKIVDQGSSEQDLYVALTMRIENHLTVPLFLKDFTITLTTPEGEISTIAIEKQDLNTVYTAFPDMKPLMTSPLLRETDVPPGETREGTLLAQFAIPRKLWDERKSATITVDFYHQDSMTIPVPKP
jgi:hypothetical protein